MLEELTRLARSKPRTVVLAEAADERILCAASILAAQRIASPILTGLEDEIRAIASDCNVSLDGIRIVDPSRDTGSTERYVHACAEGPRPLKPESAQRLMQKPLMYGAMMVRQGDADAIIAGASVTTARVIEAGLRIFGTMSGIKTASSYLLMIVPSAADRPERTLIFADCAVNVNPTPTQLAEITASTVRNAKRLLSDAPRVAMLSFSSKGSAKHDLVDKITQALEIVREQHPEMLIDGEFQFDTAIDPRTASLKMNDVSKVAGQANVFIFPDLNSGNIGYKITQYLAGAQAIGPILQGFAYPISDVSRGATIDDIVKATIVLLATTSAKD